MTVARLPPPSYGFENIRTIATGRATSPAALLAGASLVILGVGTLVFASVYQRAVHTGLFAGRSAESATWY